MPRRPDDPTSGAPRDVVRPAALEVLERVERGGWSDRLVQARAGRLARRRDRAQLTRLVYTTLRWQPAIDELLGRLPDAALERAALR
ncbi:MAG: hypothetical protein D6738_14190, partial [Acidobacteria bacterium]